MTRSSSSRLANTCRSTLSSRRSASRSSRTGGRLFAEGVSPRQLLTIPGLPPALGLVCYEALFPGDIVQGARVPACCINVTNDGWFGNTTGPYQHFHQSRVRAVEEGAPLIRAANNGISAVVDPYGRALQTLGSMCAA